MLHKQLIQAYKATKRAWTNSSYSNPTAYVDNGLISISDKQNLVMLTILHIAYGLSETNKEPG